jgi:hypothetical protein
MVTGSTRRRIPLTLNVSIDESGLRQVKIFKQFIHNNQEHNYSNLLFNRSHLAVAAEHCVATTALVDNVFAAIDAKWY